MPPLRMPGGARPTAPTPTPTRPAAIAVLPPPRAVVSPPAAVSSPVLVVAQIVAEAAAQIVAGERRFAEAAAGGRFANFANAVTGVYGISGSGKSSLADTAAEFAWEMFKATTLCYLTDLGGFGSKRLSLIRLGIMRVWDPRNHVNPFETMELISQGAFPERIDDPDTGRADPHVRLILPRRTLTTLVCPQGHDVATFETVLALNAAQVGCPTCKIISSIANGTTRAQIVRHRMFRSVGHRIYDSITEMNDWGMLRLGEMSAKNLLPTSANTGGSALGAADMLREGSAIYGGGSAPQVGFMQNRSYQWIANIRNIPDQVVPATCTFAVEQGKADDDSGGVPILGMQIAGNARTAKASRWVGNCLHASREPDDIGHMRYRLWTVTHLDQRDTRNIPYLAKHRGIPLDMPEYLEDPWFDEKAKRDAAAWSVCSLGVFYQLLQAQLLKLEALDRAKHADAPALQAATDDQGDDVISDVVPTAALAMISSTGPRVPVSGGQTLTARRGGLRMPGQTAAMQMPAVAVAASTPAPPAIVTASSQLPPAPLPPLLGTPARDAGTSATPVAVADAPKKAQASAPSPTATAPVPAAAPATIAPAPPSPIRQQLEASLAAAQPPSARLRTPGTVRMPGQPALAAAPTQALARRRTPRPPV